MKIFKTIKDAYILYQELKKYKKIIDKEDNMNEKKTELWLITLPIILVQTIITLLGMLPIELFAKYTTIIAGIYTISRSIVKITKNKSDDDVLDKIETILKEKNIIK